jgi:hypothetical protein
MAVPSSGELKLWDTLWNQELGGSKGENSLHSASIYAGFSTPDALSDFYGWSDVEVPTLTTNGSTSVTGTSFTANGNVTNTGNEDVSRGFYIGTSTNYASNTKYTLGGTQGTGTFSYNATGLSQATTYYVNAWASNSAGETVGAQVSATTSFVASFVTSNPSESFTYDKGNGWGNFASSVYGYYINPVNSSVVNIGAYGYAAPRYEKNFPGGMGMGGINHASNAKNYRQTRWGFCPDPGTGLRGQANFNGYPPSGYSFSPGYTSQSGTYRNGGITSNSSTYIGGFGKCNNAPAALDVSVLYCLSDMRTKTNITYL